jgi:8-oxo-dGTP pyrophosphatase MutT (NUDIX family)
MPMSDPIPSLLAALREYAGRWPQEAATAADFARFLVSHPAVFERGHEEGHLTGSAWLVSADGARVLLTHHRKLGRWLQLGGHADGDPDLARVALREAQEESGLAGLALEPGLFDLDRHWIPARGEEPGHWHYDVRYVVRAAAGEDFAVSEESLALAWRPVRELAEGAGTDASLRRMAGKWLARAAAQEIM